MPPPGPPSSDAGLTARFLLAVGREISHDALTPQALSRAVVEVLPVEAAGLSLLVDLLRLPLGASSDAARLAEQLQTTLGYGPCLDAAETRTTTVVDQADLDDRWPVYGEQLAAQTPFRSVAALPLHGPDQDVFAALDLYSTSPDLSDHLDLDEVAEQVAELVAALLTTCIERVRDVDAPESKPGWYRSAAARRHDVWVAVGMIMARRTGGRPRDALSVLRARAYADDRTLDDLAADLIDGPVPLEAFTDVGPGQQP